MKLKSFNYILGLLIIFTFSPLLGEEKIDIWKNKKKIIKENSSSDDEKDKKPNLDFSTTLKAPEKIEIQEGDKIFLDEQKVFGIYEPANYDLNLNMWSTTKAEDLRSSLKRLDKINLSKSSK